MVIKNPWKYSKRVEHHTCIVPTSGFLLSLYFYDCAESGVKQYSFTFIVSVLSDYQWDLWVHTTLLWRWINVKDVDATSQQRRVPSGLFLLCFLWLRTKRRKSIFPFLLRHVYLRRIPQKLILPLEEKWNESGFRPPLCTYRLNWARRTSWGWWDDWDDTVLQTRDSTFEPWRSEAKHATSRSRRDREPNPELWRERQRC